MSLLLRIVRKSRWLGNPLWLAAGEMQADPLADLRTSSNSLSVWEVTDDRSNLEDIVVGIASSKDYLANVDYALFEESIVGGLGIQIELTPGTTPHARANPWHRELVRLSARKLVDLAHLMMKKATLERVQENRVGMLVERSGVPVRWNEPD